MNLFRSEEHARRWSDHDPAMADTIMPLTAWARIFATPMFRARTRPDFISWLQSDEGRAGRTELMQLLPPSAQPH